jgi:arginase
MKVAILGVPMDLGAGRRGVDMGPSAIRYARLAETLVALGHDVQDHGNVDVPVLEAITPGAVPSDSGLGYLEAIRSACQAAAERLQALPDDVFPIAIGGDHSMSMGTVAGSTRGKRTGLLWVDAHTDFNVPETSPSGNIHGMPVAHLIGLGDPRLVAIGGEGPKLRPEDIVMIGIRSVDTGERKLLREHGATVFTMKDLDRLGIPRVLDEALERLSDVERLHLSFDADAIDPTFAPGVGTPVPGGLTYREAHLLMELLADSNRVTSLDLVEVNPILDRANETGRIMVEMASSLLGKTIL